MIDEYIKVLRQDFKENEDEVGGGGGEGEGDGTQIRTYINNVTIKTLTSDITKAAGDSKNDDFRE